MKIDNHLLVKYMAESQRQKNFNAYGWLMRFMQVEEDIFQLNKSRTELLIHVERVIEEVQEKESTNLKRTNDED